MKKLLLILTIWSVNVVGSLTDASIVNGSFENNLNGWLQYSWECCEKKGKHVLFDNNSVMPVDGDYFAVVTGLNTLPSPYLSQSLILEAGTVLSGSGALRIFAYYDNQAEGTYARVSISGPGATTWFPLIINKNNMTNYSCSAENHRAKGYKLWTPWEWSVPMSGEWSIYFETRGQVYLDQGDFVHGFFDDVKVSAVSSPCAYDLNADGKSNIIGYQLFIQEWGDTDCENQIFGTWIGDEMNGWMDSWS